MQNFKILCRIWKHVNSAKHRIADSGDKAKECTDETLPGARSMPLPECSESIDVKNVKKIKPVKMFKNVEKLKKNYKML